MKFATFGPGGNSESFYAEGHKSTAEAPAWVKAKGLDAYEYEAGNGLTAGEASLRKVGEEAKKHGILMSLHTPYFISLSGVDPEKRLKSVDYIKKSLWAAELLGADTIVIHSGSAAKITREEAMGLARDTLEKIIEEVGDTPIHLGLETMGKINQLGTLDEVLELCRIDSCFVPVVDFGHLNARNLGGYFKTSDDYLRVFDKISSRMDSYVAETLHCHFSKIEYTDAGEKKHLTFEDTVYGPDFEPFIEAIVKGNLSPTVICESAGTQSIDALTMKALYKSMI